MRPPLDLHANALRLDTLAFVPETEQDSVIIVVLNQRIAELLPALQSFPGALDLVQDGALGVSREELIQALHDGVAKYASIFNYPALTWADIGAIGWLVDGAAIVNQVSLQRTSYGPYARGMVRICKEESFHQRQGYHIMMTLARGSAAQKAMAQDALDRFWWPSLMMFGPHDAESAHSAQSMKWKIKRQTNDELRQKYVDQSVKQAEVIGLTIPDPDLKWNEARGHYDFGAIDWDEFNRVINGNGLCNRQRVAHHIKAHEEGAWVRDAIAAYESKKSKRASSAAA